MTAGPDAADAAGAAWQDLSAQITSCTACADLVATRTTVVPGVRPAHARLLLVGEAPGATEDATGLPFAGRAGQLLDVFLTQAGLDRAQVGVVNVLKCRPPGNRTPSRAELGRCRPWLDRQLDIADPDLVVCLGGTATGWFLGAGVRLGASRQKVHQVAGRSVVVTYHPSAVLRSGPLGAPALALREDLAWVAQLLTGAAR